LINAQVDVHIVLLPEDSDPDSIINQQGADALRELIGGAIDFFHFYRKVVKTETLEQEIALIKDIIQIIAKIQDPIRFDRYLKHVAYVFDIKPDTIEKEMAHTAQVGPKNPRNFKISQEERLMAMILNGFEYFSLAKERLKPSDFAEEGIRKFFSKLIKEENFDVANLSDMVDGNLREKLLSVIMKEEPVSRESMLEAIKTFKGRLEKKRIMKKISEAIDRGDDAARQRYQKQLLDINVEDAANIEH